MNMLPRPVSRHSLLRRFILTTTMLPAVLAFQALGLDWSGTATLTINPTVVTGLQEGHVDGSPFDLVAPNPANGPDTGSGVGISLGIRMGQSTLNLGDSTTADPDNFWADNRTWIYSGEINSGSTGRLSFAESIDDSTQIKIDGIVVLQDGRYNVPTTTGVLTLAPNTFHTFEVRMGNGTGGAGPVTLNNFSPTYGFGFSQTGATGTDGASYAAPVDPGTGSLFHIVTAEAAAAGQDINVLSSTIVTLAKVTNDHITENSITFAPTVGNATTLTVNGSTAGGTLRSLNTVLALASTKTITIAGDADFAPGALSAGPTIGTATLTGVVLQKGSSSLAPGASGAGTLILDNPTNFLTGTTLKVYDGLLSVVGGGGAANPISSLTTNVEIAGNSAGTFLPVLRFGGGGTATTFTNKVTVTNNGTIQHVSQANDLLTSAAQTIAITAGKTLTFNVTGGGMAVDGVIAGILVGVGPSTAQAGGTVKKMGVNTTLQLRGTTFLTGINAAEGRLEVSGQLKLNSPQTISIGANATLALLNSTSASLNRLPATLTVTQGTLEGVPGAFTTSTGAPSNLSLGGGTLTLGPGFSVVSSGLIANLYTPGSSAAAAAFNTFSNYQNYFVGRGSGTVTTTGANGVVNLAYGVVGGNTAMFAPIAPTFTVTDEIVSRMHGKILITNPGSYTFGTDSDDGSMLYIDQATVVSNNFSQGHTRRTGTVTLCAGLHDIDIGYYEGGGLNSLVVDYKGPDTPNGPTDPATTIPNSVLIPVPSEVIAYANPVAVTQSAVINANGMSLPSVSLTAAKTLTINGYRLNMGATTLTGAGTYTIDTATQYGEVTATSITDGGAVVSLVKNGNGTLILEAGAVAQLQGVGSSITAAAGGIGLVLGPVSPKGVATLNVNGKALILSSKGGDQTLPLPTFTDGGDISSRKLGSGVAGVVGTPIVTTLTGNLALNSGKTISLSTSDNYALAVAGISGNATVNMNGGIIRTSGTVNVGGPLNVACSALTASQSIAAGAITIGDSTVTGSSSLSAAGALNVTNSTVNTTGPISATGAMTVSSGNVTAHAAISAASITANNSTITNFGNITTGATGITLNGNGSVASTLAVNGGTVTGGNILAHGGIIHAVSGLTTAAVSATFTGFNPTGLKGKFIFTGGTGQRIPPNTQAGMLAIETGTNGLIEKVLNQPLSFPNNGTGDASIGAFFGADTGPGFAIGFFGNFTAPVSGIYQLQTTGVDDDAGFWVDLDNNGLFETAGGAGNELIARMNCCGDGQPGNVTLVGGHTYKVGIAVEDGQGESGLVGRIALPGGAFTTVDPSAADQSTWWSYGLPNQVLIDSGAELDIQAINGEVNVIVNGHLQFDGAGSSSMTSLSIGAGAIVEAGPGLPLAPAEAVVGGAEAVPEPGSFSLIVLGALGCFARRSRAVRG